MLGRVSFLFSVWPDGNPNTVRMKAIRYFVIDKILVFERAVVES